MEDAVRQRAETAVRDRDEVDEEQMEQFFAIVRRLRDGLAAAGRIRPRPDLEEEEEEGIGGRKKRMRSGKKSRGGGGSSWFPKFERGDFETEVKFTGRSLGGSRISATIGNGGADQVKKKMKKAEDEEQEDKCKLKLLDDHLDLELTL